MYHCPDCTTPLSTAQGAAQTDSAPAGLTLVILYYDCPGCGHKFLYRRKEYAERDATEEWYHVAAGGQTLLMHNPPSY